MCVSCAAKSASVKEAKEEIVCSYTKEQLEAWKPLIQCAYTNKIISEFLFHSSIGIINSALKRANVCYFHKYLNTVQLTINQILAEGSCL